MVNFYRHFISKAAMSMEPLHDMLRDTKKGNDSVIWNDVREKSFSEIKAELSKAILLA